MLARYIDPASGKPYDKGLTREQAVQYCTQRGCLLVDETDDLFILFHWTMHNAIQIVFSETMIMDDQGMQVSSTSLQHWSSCSFIGEDSFLEVMDKVGHSMVTIVDYLQFCLDIPFISDFMSFIRPNENKCICVSIHMSFDNFRTYVRENNDRRSLHSVAQNDEVNFELSLLRPDIVHSVMLAKDRS
jgi:2-hydroxy-3-keto-5-methylthiopentenyl-1-phosphate phosphatase